VRRDCEGSCREFVDPAVDWGWGQWGGIGVAVVDDDVQRWIMRRARHSV
jgi:hypothetical protein